MRLNGRCWPLQRLAVPPPCITCCHFEGCRGYLGNRIHIQVLATFSHDPQLPQARASAVRLGLLLPDMGSGLCNQSVAGLFASRCPAGAYPRPPAARRLNSRQDYSSKPEEYDDSTRMEPAISEDHVDMIPSTEVLLAAWRRLGPLGLGCRTA